MTFLCFLTAGLLIGTEPVKPQQPAAKGISLRLVDAEGQPIGGAKAGFLGYFHPGKDTPPEWKYVLETISGPDGMVRIEAQQDADGDEMDPREFAERLCLVARHDRKKLAAIRSLSPQEVAKTVAVTLRPECRVTAALKCRELEKRGRGAGGGVAIVSLDDKPALELSAIDDRLDFFLPPGKFTVESYGSNTHHVESSVVIKENEEVREMPDVDHPATRLALLEGEPAPELGDVRAWKNSRPLKLRDLRGKYVLLEFWGHWCDPCVYAMPNVLAIYDKYPREKLEVVGVHIDLGEDEKTPIDTVEKLDEKLAAPRKNLWNGRDLPFPVALIHAKEVPYRDDVKRQARCKLSAEFGVLFYPTTILIDPQGRVVGKCDPRVEKHRERLDRLLKGGE